MGIPSEISSGFPTKMPRHTCRNSPRDSQRNCSGPFFSEISPQGFLPRFWQVLLQIFPQKFSDICIPPGIPPEISAGTPPGNLYSESIKNSSRNFLRDLFRNFAKESYRIFLGIPFMILAGTRPEVPLDIQTIRANL